MTTDLTGDRAKDAFTDADRTLTGVIDRASRVAVDVDIDRIAVVWFHGLVVGNGLVDGFDDLTSDDWARGATVGAITIADRRGQGLMADESLLGDASYRVVATVAKDASEGRVDLIDAMGNVSASTALQACGPRLLARTAEGQDAQATASIVGKIGRASISAGKWYICFDYDDPPGTPNGKCWEWCLRIPEPPRDPGPVA
jgi:hypothetical protein